MKRIAVLTSGGDAPGMNAAVRAVVRQSNFRRNGSVRHLTVDMLVWLKVISSSLRCQASVGNILISWWYFPSLSSLSRVCPT